MRILLLLLCLLCFAGCRHSSDAPPKEPTPQAAQQQRAVSVEVAVAITAKITDYREFTGRTVASHAVEIRPRVSGYLKQAPHNLEKVVDGASNAKGEEDDSSPESEKRDEPLSDSIRNPGKPFKVTVKEGDEVKRNEPLFHIDPRPYEIALEQASGSKLALKAQNVRFKSELARLEKLKLSNSISDSDVEAAQASVDESAAQLKTLEASIERAKLDLKFTRILAPIDGVLGRTLVMEENIVKADDTLLTTIVSTNPIHVFFDMDEASYLAYRRMVTSGELYDTEGRVPARLALTNENGFPHAGHIDFANNTTDPNSGNTLIRAEFENEKKLLAPGLYCRVRVPFSPEHEAVLVPTKCLAMDQVGRYVMVVGPDKIVQRRAVRVGNVHSTHTVILEGLEQNELVVYDGLQKVRERSLVEYDEKSKKAPSFTPARDEE